MTIHLSLLLIGKIWESPHFGTSDTPLFWIVLETKYVNFRTCAFIQLNGRPAEYTALFTCYDRNKIGLLQSAHDFGPRHEGY